MINEDLRVASEDCADPPVRVFLLAALRGDVETVDRLLKSTTIDPTLYWNRALETAAWRGHLSVVERLLEDKRVDPSFDNSKVVRIAAENNRVMIIERLMRDQRVDPSAEDNVAVRWASQNGHLAVVDRLLEDDRVDVAVALRNSRPNDIKRFECRERITEICIALQAMSLPAWVTIKILKAARPWSTLPLHSKWALVCAVKHFHDKRQC